MNTREIRYLIDFISKSGLNEVSIETEELKIKIKRDASVKTQVFEGSASKSVQIDAPSGKEESIYSGSANNEQASTPSDSVSTTSNNYLEVKSPMIGTFYRSANPDSDPFFNVGDSIDVGQTVCIIEAMKLFNEIESEVSGKIVKILVENATPVEYDQPLFLIDPS